MHHAKEIKKESKEFSFFQMMVGEFVGSFILLIFMSGAGFYAMPPASDLVRSGVRGAFVNMISSVINSKN